MSDDDVRKYYENKQLKNNGVAIVFAVILGLFGLMGIGHIYIGKTGKGIAYLISGLLILGISIILSQLSFFIVISIFIYLIVFIHQILSVRDYCNKFNDYFIRTKRSLW